jgi:hypothetical protein
LIDDGGAAMLLWKYVMRVDDEQGLADPDRGFEWFKSHRWVPERVGPDGAVTKLLRKWDLVAREEWQQCVLVLRSLGQRLGGYRPKQPVPVAPEELSVADRVFGAYLKKLRAVCKPRPRKDGKRQPLGRKNFTGIHLCPTMAPQMGDRGQREVIFNPIDHFDDMDVFWQSVFYSLVSDSIDPVCKSCGQRLVPSKGGRLSRREKCPRCTNQSWYKKRPTNEKRKAWKEAQRRRRGHE